MGIHQGPEEIYPTSVSLAMFEATICRSRSPKDHINTRILHSGSKAEDKADSRNHALYDPWLMSFGPVKEEGLQQIGSSAGFEASFRWVGW